MVCVCVCALQTEWEEVKKEMVEGKGLEEAVADKIGEYVKLSGHFELLEKLMSDMGLTAVASARAGLEDMKLLLHSCELFGVLDKVCNTILIVCSIHIRRTSQGTACGPIVCADFPMSKELCYTRIPLCVVLLL